MDQRPISFIVLLVIAQFQKEAHLFLSCLFPAWRPHLPEILNNAFGSSFQKIVEDRETAFSGTWQCLGENFFSIIGCQDEPCPILFHFQDS